MKQLAIVVYQMVKRIKKKMNFIFKGECGMWQLSFCFHFFFSNLFREISRANVYSSEFWIAMGKTRNVYKTERAGSGKGRGGAEQRLNQNKK